MFVIIGTTTADLIIRPQDPPVGRCADGFQANNLAFFDAPPLLLLGGNGGISACVAAGLGIRTALWSAIGDDAFGRTLWQWLEERGVNLDGLTRSDTHATSTSVILFSDATNQVVYHHLGATSQIRPEDVPGHLLAEGGVLLASSYPLIHELRNGGLQKILRRAQEAGCITALDIGPAIGDPVTLEEIVPLLPYTHYLIANTHEINVLAGTDDWETAAAKTLNAGAQNLIVKRGRDGASVRGHITGVDVPGFNVEANISVGAGDAFNAGFLYSVKRGLSVEQAIRYGNAVGALVVSGERGALSAPTLGEIENFLAAHG
jgi:ribokinase